jgi:hypothetical protein
MEWAYLLKISFCFASIALSGAGFGIYRALKDNRP